MKLNDKFELPASREEVFASFMNVEQLATCIPGVSNVKMLEDQQYEALLEVKIQFMKIRFSVNGDMKVTVPGEELDIQMSGKPNQLAGVFKNQLTVKLTELEPKLTEVHYDLDVQMTGRLASLGEILVRGTIVKTAKDFVDNVKATFQ